MSNWLAATPSASHEWQSALVLNAVDSGACCTDTLAALAWLDLARQHWNRFKELS